MKRLIFLISLIMLSVLSGHAQKALDVKQRGVKRVYAGYGVGYNFDQAQSSISLRVVFKNAPVLYLDYTNQALESIIVRSGYSPEFSLLFQGPPADIIQSFAIMGGKEYQLSKSLSLIVAAGVNYSKEINAYFIETRISETESTYELERQLFSTSGGLSARCGITWATANWCGFSAELLGNLNAIKKYGGARLTFHLGWMGKED